MFPRLLKPPQAKSFFLFGPRGTGKTSWVKTVFSDAVYIDLLESDVYLPLQASPQRLASFLPSGHRGTIVIDEVQRVPALLDEVHRLIESHRLTFVLTGSSARKLRGKGVNLLAGRALTKLLHPLTASETGNEFKLGDALRFGMLPSVFQEPDRDAYLKSYVTTYLREEVQQEGLTRNLAAFARFLEAASFSQASLLTVSEVARECSLERKLVDSYFQILDDLLIGVRLQPFTRRARRELAAHPKFYLFDTGVYRAIRPAGPLDDPAEIDGAALETLVLQQLRALNDALDLGYTLHFWRTRGRLEVDFILYGKRGLLAFEVKRSRRVRGADLRGLQAFRADYPMAKVRLLYGGSRVQDADGIEVLPVENALRRLPELLQ